MSKIISGVATALLSVILGAVAAITHNALRLLSDVTNTMVEVEAVWLLRIAGLAIVLTILQHFALPVLKRLSDRSDDLSLPSRLAFATLGAGVGVLLAPHIKALG